MVRGCTRAVVLALALSAPAGAAAQAPALARLASVSVPGPVAALAAGDGLVVAAIGSSVHVIDVTRPEAPEVVGRHDFDQPALGVVVDGRLAYVANSHDGLRRLDLSDPAAPALTGTAPTRGQAVGVAGSGRYFFTADNSIGFDIVDVAGDPTRAGEYLADGFPRGIAAAGSRVFVADQPAGLMVVDVSDPASPRVEGGLSLGRDPVLQVFAPHDRSTNGAPPTVVCIVSGRDGMQVVDISDPSAPRVAAAVPGGGAAERRGPVGASALHGRRRRPAGVRPERPGAAGARGIGGDRRADRPGGRRCDARLRGERERGQRLPPRVERDDDGRRRCGSGEGLRLRVQ